MKPGHPFQSPEELWQRGPWFWHHGPFHEFFIPSWAALPLFLLGAGIYFLPTLVAYWRGHHNRFAIGLLNLLLGWTLFGWAIALVWAVTVVRRVDSRSG
jgi:hypothetical protein